MMFRNQLGQLSTGPVQGPTVTRPSIPSGPTPEQIAAQAKIEADAAAQASAVANLNSWLSAGGLAGKASFETSRGLSFVPKSAAPGFKMFFVDFAEMGDDKGLPFTVLSANPTTTVGVMEASAKGKISLASEVAKGRAVLFSEKVPKNAQAADAKLGFVTTSSAEDVAKLARSGGGYGIFSITDSLREAAEKILAGAAPAAPAAPAVAAPPPRRQPLQPSEIKSSETLDQISKIAEPVVGIASIYHGYKRNNGSIAWALGWGIFGYSLWFLAGPVMFAQGFGKPAGKSAASAPAAATPNRKRRR